MSGVDVDLHQIKRGAVSVLVFLHKIEKATIEAHSLVPGDLGADQTALSRANKSQLVIQCLHAEGTEIPLRKLKPVSVDGFNVLCVA
jgi:hypothetical protein